MNTKSIRWAFNVSKWCPTYSDIQLASSCIQVEEKERLARFFFKDDVKRSLIGLLMLRKYVCDASCKPYNEIKFQRDERGKPQLIYNNLNLQFNVSHQGDYVVCVGEIGQIMLGVDVMKLEYSGGKTLPDFFRIMNRQFSPEEWITIKGSGSEKEQIAMFCRHWSLKESYVKAVGVGITVNLQEICFKINTKFLQEGHIVDDTELFVNGEKLNWKFHEVLLDPDHCVSVAFNNHSAPKIPFNLITFNELMQDCITLLGIDELFVTQYFAKLQK